MTKLIKGKKVKLEYGYEDVNMEIELIVRILPDEKISDKQMEWINKLVSEINKRTGKFKLKIERKSYYLPPTGVDFR